MNSSLLPSSGRLGRMFALLLAGLLASPAFAAPDLKAVFASPFNDQAGTELAKVANQPATLRWSRAIAGVTTTGAGTLRLRADGQQDGVEAMAFLPLNKLVKPGQTLWLIVEFEGWKFTGGRDEQLRIGFMHGNTGENPPPLAQMRFTRGSKGVLLAGEAFNTAQGATHIASQPVAPAETSERQIFALEYVPAENRYTLYRHSGGEKFEPLGSGTTSAQRKPNFLRLHLRGDFASTPDEFVDIGNLLLFVASPSGSIAR